MESSKNQGTTKCKNWKNLVVLKNQGTEKMMRVGKNSKQWTEKCRDWENLRTRKMRDWKNVQTGKNVVAGKML